MCAVVDPVLRSKQVKELKQKIAVAREKISELQKDCKHNLKRVWGRLTTNEYKFKVVAYRCVSCGIQKDKNGGPTHCEVCDGTMKFAGYVPGQGGGCRVYRCLECGRSSDSDDYGVYKSGIPKEDFVSE